MVEIVCHILTLHKSAKTRLHQVRELTELRRARLSGMVARLEESKQLGSTTVRCSILFEFADAQSSKIFELEEETKKKISKHWIYFKPLENQVG